MAVKFSQFNVGATVSDIDYIVGYKSTDNVKIPIGLVTANTTYTVATAQSGLNETLTLTGSDASTDVITFTAGANITLTDDGVGNGFTIQAKGNVDGTGTANSITKWADADTITDSIMSETAAGGQFTDPYITVVGAGGGVSTQNLEINGFLLDSNGQKGTAGQILSSTGTLTDWVDAPSGETYDLNSTTDGANVDVNLTSTSGTDNSFVKLVPAGGITISQVGNVVTLDTSSLDTRLTTAEADIDTNTASITTEETARIAADTTLQTNIDNEAATRLANDNTLQSNIDAEAATRLANDNTLQGNIDTEASTRSSADTALQGQIDSNDTDIATNASNIATNVTDIATNVTNIASNDTDISNLQSSKQNISEKNQANGYAPLDSGAKIPIANLPDSVVGQVEYQGTWNASTNTPTLPPAVNVKGHYYVTSVAGTYLTIDYAVGDWVISNGTSWEKIDNTDAVTTVFGRLGAIVANEGDYSSYYPLIADLTAAEADIATNATNISSNDTDITALQNDKYDKTGGTITGNATITGSFLVDTNTLYVNSSTNTVGIGTLNPTRQFTVNGTSSSVININSNASNGVSILAFGDSDDDNYAQIVLDNSQNKLQIQNGGGAGISNRGITIDSSENVGIGTASPSEKLHIEGNARITGALHDSNNSAGTSGQVLSSTATGTDWVSLSEISGVDGSGTANYVPKWTDGDTIGNSVIYDNGVSVGIGTTTPTGTLDVSGTITATGGNSTQWNEAYSWGNPQALMSDISFGESYISNYRSRVLDNTGTYFPSTAGYDLGVLKNQGFMDKASLIFLPTGVKDGGLFSVKPKNVGDFDFTRATTATYVDEDGLIATAPTNTPRVNYPIVNGVVQATPSLLLEPARTNLVTYSEDFTQVWTKVNSTVTSNQVISPDGTQNADLITNTSTNGYVQFTTALNANLEYTFSAFVKAGTSNLFTLVYTPAMSEVIIVEFDLLNKTATDTGSGTPTHFGIEEFANGWFRIFITEPKNGTTGSTNARVVLSGSTSDTGYIWGAQLEQSSYATSYIPTSGSTVTRNADVANGAGDASTFNDSEGVLFAEISALADDLTFRTISIGDGSDDNAVRIRYRTTSNIINGLIRAGGVTYSNCLFEVQDITTFSKAALKYKSGDVSFWVNGYKINSSDTFSLSGLSAVNFDQSDGGNDFYGNTKQLMTFKETLTDAELENLTSWDSFIELAQGQQYITY